MTSASHLRPRRSTLGSALRWIARDLLPPAVMLVLLALGWQIIAAHNSQAIPTIGAVASSLGHRMGFYASNAAWTLEEMLVGLAVSFVVAFSLAVVMAHVRVVERAVMPLAVILNVTPVVSFAPGLVILFGFSVLPRFIVTGVIVFFPFLVNSLIGLKSVDFEALEFFQTLNATRREVLVRLRIPSSLPFLFAAARIGVPLSLVGAVVAEFTTSGTSRGLGAEIEIAYGFGDLPVVYGAVFCLAVIGVLSTMVVVVTERRLLGWHASFNGHER